MLVIYELCNESHSTDDDFSRRIEAGDRPQLGAKTWMNPDTQGNCWQVIQTYLYQSLSDSESLCVAVLCHEDAVIPSRSKWFAEWEDYPDRALHLLMQENNLYRYEIAVQGEKPRVGERVLSYEPTDITTPYESQISRAVATDFEIDSFNTFLPNDVSAPYPAVYVVQMARVIVAA